MRIKVTALLFSALLPFSVFAATEAPAQASKTAQQEQRMQERQQMMQQRQSAWFDELELTTEQRASFQEEMQQHRAQQQAARKAHHDKLRGVLNAEQQIKFDKKISTMQNNMHKKQKMHRSGKTSRANCQNQPSGKCATQ